MAGHPDIDFHAHRGGDPGPLTPREHEIAEIVATQGIGSYAIAKSLCISVSTVRSHFRSISTKIPGPGRVRERIILWWYYLK